MPDQTQPRLYSPWVPPPSGYPGGPWTPGSNLLAFREIVFGTYVFPLSFQETTRSGKIKMDRVALPFNYGEWVSPYSSKAAREIEISGSLGSGVTGSGDYSVFAPYPNPRGSQLATGDDLEAERAWLEAMMDRGAQPLYTRWDRYCTAYLSEFEHKPLDGASYRAADWTCKFIAADPRYYGAPYLTTWDPTLTAQGNAKYAPGKHQILIGGAGGGPYVDVPIGHYGNTYAFPSITIRATANWNPSYYPWVEIYTGSNFASAALYTSIAFSKLRFQNGDQLVIQCDPRPETRQNAAAILNPTSNPVNALIYINPATDFANNRDSSQFFPFIAGDTMQPPASGSVPNQVWQYIAMGYAILGTPNSFTPGQLAGFAQFNATVNWVDTWL